MPESFDVALNMETSLGSFTREQVPQFLGRACESLRPGGRFAVHIFHTENNYDHPNQLVITRLENSDTVQNFYMTACEPDRTHVPGSTYGTQNLEGVTRVAGLGPKKGDIVLTAMEDQSKETSPRFDVSYWEGEITGEKVIHH